MTPIAIFNIFSGGDFTCLAVSPLRAGCAPHPDTHHE